MKNILFVVLFALMMTNIFATERFLSRTSRMENGLHKIQQHHAKCAKGETACGNMCCGYKATCCSHVGAKGATYLSCC